MSIVLTRRGFLAVGAALALAACGGTEPEPPQEKAPASSEQDADEVVDETPVSPKAEAPSTGQPEEEPMPAMTIEVNGASLPVTLADNEAARELSARLADGPVTLDLAAYGGFEKVGPLGFPLPTSDERVTTQAGDVMLYQGDRLTVFTGPNTWSYTRIGRIRSVGADELADLLGEGDVTATLSTELR